MAASGAATGSTTSQAMGAEPGAVASAPALQSAPTAQEMLVSRIALYPDDLIAIILPAATKPLDIVEAERFLEKRKKDPKLVVPSGWDDSVKSLLNYPVVVTSMSQDLDWTKALGDAVIADQSGMIAAVQSYRRKVNAAGNLKSDGKQTVVVEKEVIKIVQADPQVIYVPQYNPVSVMSYGYSSWGYYGAPYPVYYYPYPPGAAIGAGIIWGAAIGSAWNGGRYVSHYDGVNNIQIDRGDINIDRGDINVGGGRGENRPARGNPAQGNPGRDNAGQGNRAQLGPSAGTSDAGRGSGSKAWSPGAGQTGPKVGNRVGDAQASNRMGSSSSMGPQVSNRAGGSAMMGPQAPGRTGGSSAGSMGPRVGDNAYSGRARSSDFGGGARSGQYGGGSRASAFDGYGGRASTSMSSARGSMSRSGARVGGRRSR